MKRSVTFFGLAFLAGFSAWAQVTVEVELDQRQFLPSETLPVTVRITNRSGQPLHLGAEENWLTFSVNAEDNYAVTKLGDAPVRDEFELGSSKMATKRVNLAPYFKLTRQGSYRISATVRIPEWNRELTSPPQSFDVIDGAKLWSQTFGLPVPAGMTNTVPEIRRYTLEEANYLKSQLRMYVQVSDESESQIIRVQAIGPMVSFSQPEARLDRRNRLHVLYQSGAHVFSYTIVNPDGDILRQENYDYFTSRPRLQIDEAGNITVLGGVRRVKPDDAPLVQPPAPLPPPATNKPRASLTPPVPPSK
ncbi:MAG TPA: hypothetical protein VMB80_10905 [Candidatus Acidoferrum sp.]|nr:hypothetical protein [Candidatus Acidoferrum sp.]